MFFRAVQVICHCSGRVNLACREYFENEAG
jgi:hypothetical protein